MKMLSEIISSGNYYCWSEQCARHLIRGNVYMHPSYMEKNVCVLGLLLPLEHGVFCAMRANCILRIVFWDLFLLHAAVLSNSDPKSINK